MYKIQTYHGHIIDYENPNPIQIDIRDIARNLSFENRFLGQAHGPYSVAQHCALGSELFIEQGKPEFALQFLLHDAAEAYLKDIPTPLKRLLGDAYKNIERKFELAIIEKFEVEDSYPNLLLCCKCENGGLAIELGWYSDLVEDGYPKFFTTWTNNEYTSYDFITDNPEVTHWRPLPPPPTE